MESTLWRAVSRWELWNTERDDLKRFGSGSWIWRMILGE